MQQSMKLSRINAITTALVFINIAMLLVSLFFVLSSHKKVVKLEEDRFELINQAKRLIETSNYLTNEVRAYSQFGVKRHYDNYWNEVNVLNNRSDAVEKMKAIGLSAEEEDIVEQVKALSDSLIPLEQEAMKQVEAKNFEAARHAVYGDEYQQVKDQITALTDSFQTQLEERAYSLVGDEESKNNFLTFMFVGNIVILIAIQTFVVIFNRRKVVKPITSVSKAIKNLSMGNISTELELKPSNSEIGQLVDAYYDIIKTISVLVNEFDTLRSSVVYGKINDRAKGDGLNGCFKDVMTGANSIVGSLVNYIDNLALPIITVDKNLKINYCNTAVQSLLEKDKKQILGVSCSTLFNTNDCNTSSCAVKKCMNSGFIEKATTQAKIGGKVLDIEYTGIPIKDDKGVVVGALEYVVDLSEIHNAQRAAATTRSLYQDKEIDKLVQQLERLANGNLDLTYAPEKPTSGTEDLYVNFEKISNSLTLSSKTIKGYIEEISSALKKLSGKELTVSIDREYLGDFVELKHSINSISESLNSTFLDILQSATQVEYAAEQSSDASQTLAQGATQQASAVEEVNATVESVSSQTRLNSENANRAKELSLSSKANAENGNKQILEMVSAMDAIKESSKDIAKIIQVIDEIAFQTNLLALNASVEAARAGQHGKGFAVVAEEVRNLAARSGKAVKETTVMIDNSIARVEEGSKIAGSTKEALDKIVASVVDTAELVSTIANSSQEQAAAIEQIEEGVSQISAVTMSNTSTAEESASTSQEMSAQSQILKRMISEFKLKH